MPKVLTVEQAREAVRRAEGRIQAQLPGDEKLARIALKKLQTRLAQAEAAVENPN